MDETHFETEIEAYFFDEKKNDANARVPNDPHGIIRSC